MQQKKIFKIIICLASLLTIFFFITGTVVYAQENERSLTYDGKKVLTFGAKKMNNDSIKDFFVAGRDSNKREPQKPSLILSTHDSKFHFAVSGYVKLTVAYDVKGSIDNNDFITSLIPTEAEPGNSEAFRMDASSSMLSFKSLVNTEKIGPVIGYISANFRGPNLTYHLRNAYLTLLNFTFGYTETTLCDVGAEPNTIDLQGPNAMTLTRNTQVRYVYNPSKAWQLAIAVEKPNLNASYSTLSQNLYQRVPDIPLYVQFSRVEGSHIRLSSVFRSLIYRNLNTEKNSNNFAWGVQCSGIEKIIPKFTLYYQGIYGKGISTYIQDLSNLGLDMAPDSDVAGKLSPVPVYSWYGGIQYNFTPDFYCSATYSQVRVRAEENLQTPDMYKLSQYIVANAFWNITPGCQLGLEYLHGTRENMNGNFGSANRIQAMVQYNF